MTFDERIALAEHRLVVREQALQHAARALLHRVQAATEPRRLVRPATYAVVALALLWGAARLTRRWRGAGTPDAVAASTAAPAARSAPRLGGMPWERTAALLWPLLPSAWRARMRPDVAPILLAVVLPLAGYLFRKRRRAPLPSQRPD